MPSPTLGTSVPAVRSVLRSVCSINLARVQFVLWAQDGGWIVAIEGLGMTGSSGWPVPIPGIGPFEVGGWRFYPVSASRTRVEAAHGAPGTAPPPLAVLAAAVVKASARTADPGALLEDRLRTLIARSRALTMKEQ